MRHVCTHVYCGICPYERECCTKRTNHERCAITGPHSRILIASRRAKDLGGRRLRSIVDQRNQDSEEAQDVQHHEAALHLGQQAADHGVEEDTDQDDGPRDERALPAGVHICVVGPVDQAQRLDHAGRQESAGCDGGHPREHRHPPCDVAEEVSVPPGRQHADPVVLPSRGGRHGGQLADGYEGAQGAAPDEDELPDKACRAAIDEARSEETASMVSDI